MKPLTPSTPHVVIMVGIPGAGKTAFAERFAKTFSAPVVNVRELQQVGKLSDGAAAKITNTFLTELLKTERTFIYEGPTATINDRQITAQKISKAGYKPLFVWVQTESIAARRRATKAGSGMNDAEFDKVIQTFQAPTEKERVVVISGKHTYATQLKMVLKHLNTPRPETVRVTERAAPSTSSRSIKIR